MTETDRNQLCSPRNNLEFVYEDEFIDAYYLWCLPHTVYVVIKTLYIYDSKISYINNPR